MTAMEVLKIIGQVSYVVFTVLVVTSFVHMLLNHTRTKGHRVGGTIFIAWFISAAYFACRWALQ